MWWRDASASSDILMALDASRTSSSTTAFTISFRTQAYGSV